MLLSVGKTKEMHHWANHARLMSLFIQQLHFSCFLLHNFFWQKVSVSLLCFSFQWLPSSPVFALFLPLSLFLSQGLPALSVSFFDSIFSLSLHASLFIPSLASVSSQAAFISAFPFLSQWLPSPLFFFPPLFPFQPLFSFFWLLFLLSSLSLFSFSPHTSVWLQQSAGWTAALTCQAENKVAALAAQRCSRRNGGLSDSHLIFYSLISTFCARFLHASLVDTNWLGCT